MQGGQLRRRWIVDAIAAVSAALLLLGCNEADEQSASPRVTDLPELATGQLPHEDLLSIHIEGAMGYLNQEVCQTAAFYGEEVLGTAHVRAARMRLSAKAFREDRAPLALFGSCGIDGKDDEYVCLYVLNEHRETSALWLVIRREDKHLATVRIVLPLDAKDIELVLPHFLNIEPISWTELETTLRDGQEVYEVTASLDRYVRLPSVLNHVVAAAGEDRFNGIGNFVLLRQKNWKP